ncbi:hypothetical protein C095_10540 [Fusobacterium necrophorum subsp. funduliforme B35]|uniref:Uncharacterized protein n=1 Tax=Fusobacterium necrophorum subsp. funduliforme B35 TaxID=1226633 RepID=A0A0B4EN90_9FUSO|nr:hypothetical protein C095_10540 [Fusobacterium necrophorum subsp. funduliforme B35]
MSLIGKKYQNLKYKLIIMENLKKYQIRILKENGQLLFSIRQILLSYVLQNWQI